MPNVMVELHLQELEKACDRVKKLEAMATGTFSTASEDRIFESAAKKLREEARELARKYVGDPVE